MAVSKKFKAQVEVLIFIEIIVAVALVSHAISLIKEANQSMDDVPSFRSKSSYGLLISSYVTVTYLVVLGINFGTRRSSKSSTKSAIIFAHILMAIILSIGSTTYQTVRSNVDRNEKAALDSFKHYDFDESLRNKIDRFQEKYECCGVFNYSDYRIGNFACSSEKLTTCALPSSCFKMKLNNSSEESAVSKVKIETTWSSYNEVIRENEAEISKNKTKALVSSLLERFFPRNELKNSSEERTVSEKSIETTWSSYNELNNTSEERAVSEKNIETTWSSYNEETDTPFAIIHPLWLHNYFEEEYSKQEEENKGYFTTGCITKIHNLVTKQTNVIVHSIFLVFLPLIVVAYTMWIYFHIYLRNNREVILDVVPVDENSDVDEDYEFDESAV